MYERKWNCKSNINNLYNECKYPVDMFNKMYRSCFISLKNTRYTIAMTNSYQIYKDIKKKNINMKISFGTVKTIMSFIYWK